MSNSKMAAFFGNRIHIGSLPIVRPHGAIKKSDDLRVNKKLEKKKNLPRGTVMKLGEQETISVLK